MLMMLLLVLCLGRCQCFPRVRVTLLEFQRPWLSCQPRGIMSTSGRIHEFLSVEFLLLLHILFHRQAVNLFEFFGEETTDNAFTFRRAAYFYHKWATIMRTSQKKRTQKGSHCGLTGSAVYSYPQTLVRDPIEVQFIQRWNSLKLIEPVCTCFRCRSRPGVGTDSVRPSFGLVIGSSLVSRLKVESRLCE